LGDGEEKERQERRGIVDGLVVMGVRVEFCWSRVETIALHACNGAFSFFALLLWLSFGSSSIVQDPDLSSI
jgi:hypothetical protein